MNFQKAFYPSAVATSLSHFRETSNHQLSQTCSVTSNFNPSEIIIKKTYKKKTNPHTSNKNASRDANIKSLQQFNKKNNQLKIANQQQKGLHKKQAANAYERQADSRNETRQ